MPKSNTLNIDSTDIIKSNTTQNYKDGVTSVQSTEPTIDESLNFIRSKNESITSAMGEMGTVSPGNGLMPKQKSLCYPKLPYFSSKEYIDIVDDLFEKNLKEFKNKLNFKHVSFSRFKITDAASNVIKVSYLGEDMGWNLKVNDENFTYKCDQHQSRVFEVVTKYVYYDIYHKKDEDGTRIKIESCGPFNKTNFLTSLKNIPNTKGYSRYFSDKPDYKKLKDKDTSLFNCNPVETAAGIATTAFLSTVTPLLNTTPSIDYHNNTDNTSISNINSTTTTSMPEESDDTYKNYIPVAVGFFIIGMAILYPIGRYCWKKIHHSGEYNVQKRNHSDIKKLSGVVCMKSGSGNYKVLGNNISNNPITSPTTGNGQEKTTLTQVNEQSIKRGASSAPETKPLLSSSGQSNAPAKEEKAIFDDQMANKNCQSNQSKTKRAPTTPSRTHGAQQVQAEVYAQPSTELNMNNNGLKDVQCAKANEVAKPQELLMFEEQLNSKFNEILAIIPSDEQSGKAESKQPSSGKKASSILQTIEIENAPQQTSSYALGNT